LNAPRRYLLDTNIISETRRFRMNDGVQAFLAQTEANALYISVLTLGELCKGVENKRRTDQAAADLLAIWVEELRRNFADRIVPIDASIADLWGRLSADRSRPVIDTLIGATALVHGMTLVTRNAKDLVGIDVPIIDPFAGGIH
jgi:predicted nucleic acid-binding protein